MNVDAVRRIVEEQALDDGLWFVAETGAEAYLQQELRRLHAAIEGVSTEECGKRAVKHIATYLGRSPDHPIQATGPLRTKPTRRIRAK